jgi:hypothetical protein
MEQALHVTGKVEGGVIVLAISYSHELLMRTEAPKRLSKEVMECYQRLREQKVGTIETNSCIVEINSDVAGSPVVRALFELWREVTGRESGQVICVNYPQDYIASLTSLGLPSLGGFGLALTKEAAIQKLTKSGGISDIPPLS